MIHLNFNSYNHSYSLYRCTAHKPETCPLVKYHCTSYLIVRSLAVSLLLTVCLSTFDWLSYFSDNSPTELANTLSKSPRCRATNICCYKNAYLYNRWLVMGVGYVTPLTIGYLGIGCFHETASITRYLGSDVSLRTGFNCHNIFFLVRLEVYLDMKAIKSLVKVQL
jgi:hypothetical protein